MDTTEIQKNVQEYYERLFATKFDNIEDVDKFLKIYIIFLYLYNHEELENLNRLTNSRKIKQ